MNLGEVKKLAVIAESANHRLDRISKNQDDHLLVNLAPTIQMTYSGRIIVILETMFMVTLL